MITEQPAREFSIFSRQGDVVLLTSADHKEAAESEACLQYSPVRQEVWHGSSSGARHPQGNI